MSTSAAHTTLPEASVVNLPALPEAEQLKLSKRMPWEPVTRRPPAKEEVAVEEVAEIEGARRYERAVTPRAMMSPAKELVATPETARVPVVSELVVMLPAWRLVVEAVPETTSLVVLKEVVVARVAVKSRPVSVEKKPVVPRIKAEKKEAVEVAAVVVALTAVTFWKVELAKDRMPPVAVVKPVTERVPARVELPATERVPVAIRLVDRSWVAIVVEATVRAPEIEALPCTSRMLPRVVVAEPPTRRMLEVTAG